MIRPFYPSRLAMIALAASVPLLSGCLVSTAANVVTAPVRIGAKAVDMATTSQSEADQRRGRRLRQNEQRLGRAERSYRIHSEQCSRGDESACRTARTEYAGIENLRLTLPAESR